MKIMGLDLGNKTLGVAVSDSLGFLASGYTTIRFKYKDFDSALKELAVIVSELKIDEIVLGLPKNMDGSVGEQANICLNFKDMIEKNLNIKVNMLDERLTTKVALNSMIMGNVNKSNRHDRIDEMAAKVILQDYLDKIRR